MRDLRGLRTAILSGAGATVLLYFVYPLFEEPGRWSLALLPIAAASLLTGVAGLLWLRAAIENQRRLGAPVEASLWLRLLVAVFLPILGTLLLFQLAARIVDASGRASGRSDRLGGWFAWWFVAYLLSDVTDLLEIVEVEPVRLWSPLGGVFLLLALPGLHRFLRQVEEDQTGEMAGSMPRFPDAVAE